jgi:hypothetical protein
MRANNFIASLFPVYWSQRGRSLAKSFVVFSGTAIREVRQQVPSANEALRLVRTLRKLRRPAVRIEDARGKSVSFFELKALAEIESGGTADKAR